jgi:hypothetical protein
MLDDASKFSNAVSHRIASADFYETSMAVQSSPKLTKFG